jgi:hypothetical protein
MSRDDVLLVLHKKRNNRSIYYVFHANADLYWHGEEWNALVLNTSKYTYSRAKALILAHNKQKKLDTEYGVVEIF